MDDISIISCFQHISLCLDLTGNLIAFGETRFTFKRYECKRLKYPPIVFLGSGYYTYRVAVQDINGIVYLLDPADLNTYRKIKIENSFNKQNIASLSLSLDKKEYLVSFVLWFFFSWIVIHFSFKRTLMKMIWKFLNLLNQN